MSESRQCVGCGHIVPLRERVPNVNFVIHKRCLRCARCGRLAQKIFYEGSKVSSPEQLFCSQTCLLSPNAPLPPPEPKAVAKPLKPLKRPVPPAESRPPPINEPPPPSLTEMPPSSLSTTLPLKPSPSSTPTSSSSPPPSSSSATPSSSTTPPALSEPAPAGLPPQPSTAATIPRGLPPVSMAETSSPGQGGEEQLPRQEPGPLVDPNLSLSELQEYLRELEQEEVAKKKEMEDLLDEEAQICNATMDVKVDSDEVTVRKAGWVQKKGGGKRRANWTKRHLVLRLSRAAYYVKEGETDKHLKGTIDISSQTSCRLSDHRMDGRGFQITTTSRTYFITASSKGECDAWVKAFNVAISQKKRLDQLRNQGITGSVLARNKSTHLNKLRSLQTTRLTAEKEHQKCVAAIDTIRHHISQSSPSSHSAGPNPVAISVDGIPQGDPSEWSVQQVTQWLHFVGLGEFALVFQKNLISGIELLDLGQEDLEDLGIDKASIAERILKEIDQFR